MMTLCPIPRKTEQCCNHQLGERVHVRRLARFIAFLEVVVPQSKADQQDRVIKIKLWAITIGHLGWLMVRPEPLNDEEVLGLRAPRAQSNGPSVRKSLSCATETSQTKLDLQAVTPPHVPGFRS